MSRYRKRWKRHYEERGSRSFGWSRRGLYRSRNGFVLGVFRGLAEYFDLPVHWLRIIGVIVFIISGFWPIVVLYLLAAFIMKPEPVIPLDTEDEAEFYDSYTRSRTGAVHRMKRQFDNLNRRVVRMEDIVTDKEYDWEQRLNS
ncbi:MAG: PspC domain-containing protein [Proteobacteria bacterium]|nr:PspC domain-containing protein [Pseudomonadota bacterium]MBU4469724.1 PspC domain-containing protein [Pseudomonadota bacterium]MCG2751805.1 PspC domain-containing protein [Desulfobacteraceae bacterium]